MNTAFPTVGPRGPATPEKEFRAIIYAVDFAEYLRDKKPDSYNRWARTYESRTEFTEFVLCQIGIELERKRQQVEDSRGRGTEYDGTYLPPLDKVFARLASRFGKVTMPKIFQPFEPVAVRWVRETTKPVGD